MFKCLQSLEQLCGGTGMATKTEAKMNTDDANKSLSKIDSLLTLIDKNNKCIFYSKKSKDIIVKYPRNQYETNVNNIKKYEFLKYRYGTSGFRGNNTTLNSVMVRVSLLSILRSISMGNQGIGVMITASHNDEIDNGVKIIDPSGEMMDSSWELQATKLANMDENEVLKYMDKEYNNIIKNNKIKMKNKEPVLFIGRDTRPHSIKFNKIMIEIANALNIKVNVIDMGITTTPQLHYIVRRANSDIGVKNVKKEIYLKEVLKYFEQLLGLLSKNKANDDSELKSNDDDNVNLGELIIDCANGVGGVVFKESLNILKKYIKVSLIHTPSADVKVNDKCGAEHVHKKRQLPVGLSNNDIKKYQNIRMASVDGDCDRLMYFTVNKDNNLVILDGDKQICLFYAFMKDFIKECNAINDDITLTVGVVQTAYANGASTKYIDTVLGLKVVMTPTGVKHLHHESKKYDISIYYESNGHGTLLVSPNAIDKLNKLKKMDNLNDKQKTAIDVLLLLYQVSNQAIGDALSDLLLVELSLYYLGWDIIKWNSIYSEVPMLLTKLKVQDRTLFKTTNAERTCVEPQGLQGKIDELVAKYKDARSFVRPSGTEDCVRVYSEANTQNDADKLNLEVRQAVYDIAGGVGQRPTQ